VYLARAGGLCSGMKPNRLHAASVACLLAGLVALAAASPALATDVAVDQTRLRILDDDGAANALEVSPSAFGYAVVDDLTELTAGAGCAALDAHHVTCPGAFAGVVVGAGGGDDVVTLQTLAIPALVSGGEGSDLLEGGAGDDRLDGGPGEDTIVGSGGDDEMSGAGGDDMLQGGDGGDRIAGGPDADIVQGQAGSADVLSGGDGRDLVEGGTGSDTLRGGPGADVLVTGSGTDSAEPGAGDDRVFATSTATVTCGADDDVSTGSRAAPRACGRLANGEAKPDIWPPPPAGAGLPDRSQAGAAPIDASGLTVQAAINRVPLPNGLYRAQILHHGNARKLKLRVASNYDQPVRIRIRTYGRDGRQLQAFRANIRAKRWVSIDTRGDFDAIWSAKARCCVR
jgi:hypothetical protein